MIRLSSSYCLVAPRNATVSTRGSNQTVAVLATGDSHVVIPVERTSGVSIHNSYSTEHNYKPNNETKYSEQNLISQTILQELDTRLW